MNNVVKETWLLILVGLCLSACGSGSTNSGVDSSQIPIDDISALVGVYKGEEAIMLITSENDGIADEQTNEVTFTIEQSGSIRFTSVGGSTGSGQVSQDKAFQLRSDARTQFDGRCESGTLLLTGNIANNKVVAV